MQNLNTTAMDGRSRTSVCFATPAHSLPNGGSVENVGTIFNHYVHVDNRINLNFTFKFIRNDLVQLLDTEVRYAYKDAGGRKRMEQVFEDTE